MKTSFSLGILATLVFLSGCKEGSPADRVPGESEESATVACPAGQAIVHRGETRFQVPVADAFANARDHDRIQLGPGRAVATASFILNQVRGVSITGVGTTLVARSDIPVVQIFGCEGVTIEGVHVVHEIGEWCAHACVSVHRSTRITIMDCDLDGSGYWGVAMWEVSDSRIVNNLFHNCHDGFSAWGGRGIELRGNTFKGNRNEDITAGPGTFINDAVADNTFGSAPDLRDYLVIQGTDSPDGRYAVAWGSPDVKVDRNDRHAILEKPVRLETWLVERETGRIVATLASIRWHPEMMFKYFVDVSTCWRADGKAVLVVKHDRWSYHRMVAVDLDTGNEAATRVTDLTEAFRDALGNRRSLKNPGQEEKVRGLAYSVMPKEWVGKDAVLVESYGGFPKREDPLNYGEDVILNLLPDPPFITITDPS